MTGDPADRFRSEVSDLHVYLNDWLKGTEAKGDGRPHRLASALADDFVVIHPNGSRGGRDDAISAFAAAHGEKPPSYAIDINQIETRMIGPELCLCTYEERHRGEPGRARISTAVLQRLENGRIEWLFLQETPAPGLEAADTKQNFI